MSILTDRLELVPASRELLVIAQGSDAALARAIGARLPASWPPEFYGPQSLQFTLDRLSEHRDKDGWWLHWFLLREPRTLIGYGGYKGPPGEDGTIEVGYAIVDDHQGKGYATELTAGLIDHAREQGAVRRVVAETMPDRIPSIRVLEKLGFRLLGPAAEEGVFVYELMLDASSQALAQPAVPPRR